MATVRISKQLLTDVSNVIGNMRSAELRSMKAAVEPPEIDVRACIEEAVWAEAPGIRALYPNKWATKVTTADVYYLTPEGGKNGFKRVTIEPTFIPGHYANYAPDIMVPYEVWGRFPTVAAFITGEADLKQRMDEISTKYRQIDRQISDFLQSCKSLNAAIVKWEGIRMYIPADTLAEVDRKVERPARGKADEPEAPVIDTELLLSTAAAHVMLHGRA